MIIEKVVKEFLNGSEKGALPFWKSPTNFRVSSDFGDKRKEEKIIIHLKDSTGLIRQKEFQQAGIKFKEDQTFCEI